ncbi:MAG: thiamine pyrophosphate-dependent enzyme, partial [Chloroflexota bacterium]
PHTSNDPDRFYRDPEEIAEQRKHDPVLRFSTFLKQHGFLTEEQDATIAARVAAEVDEATDYARSAPPPVPEDAPLYLYGS